MGYDVVMQAISTVGFPIVCVLGMGWYVKYITDKNRDDMNTLNAQHKEELTQVTEALNNNTLALQRLCDRLAITKDDLK